MTIAFYPGSFDPITNGHLDILMQAIRITDRLVVGIGVQATKKPLFTFEERSALILESLAEADPQDADAVEVVAFDRLAVDAARQHNASLLIRGLRDGTDLDYEMQMAGMNGTMAPDIKTLFLPASPGVRHITATLVRQIAGMKGDIEPFVPVAVAAKLKKKFAR